MPQVYDTITDHYAPGWVEPDFLAAEMDRINATNFVVEVVIEIQAIGGLTMPAIFFEGAVRAAFGNLPMSQGPVVRTIAGTSTWSQHAYGNAVNTMCAGELHHSLAMWCSANRGALRIAHLLADPYFPSPLGDHFNHVHTDFYPQWGGTPPGHPI